MKPENAQDWATCPLCNGDGWFEVQPHPVPCGQCDGQGLVDALTMTVYRFPEVEHAASENSSVPIQAGR